MICTQKLIEVMGSILIDSSGLLSKKRRGFKVMAGLVGGPGGGGAPRTPKNFRKFAKIFLEKIAKMHYFRIFFKK